MPTPKLVYQLVRWYRVTVVDDLVEDGDEEVSDGDEVQEQHEGNTKATPGQHQGNTKATPGQHQGNTKVEPHDEKIIEAMQEALDEDTRPTFPIFERTKIKKMIARMLDKLKSECPDPKASNMRMTKEGEVAAHQCLEEVLHMLAGDALAIAEEAKNKETYVCKPLCCEDCQRSPDQSIPSI